MTKFNQDHYNEIKRREEELTIAYREWSDLNDAAKAAKKKWEAARDQLHSFIRSDADEDRPLLAAAEQQQKIDKVATKSAAATANTANTAPAEGMWRLSIEFLEAGKANEDKLRHNGITTLGDLSKRMLEKGELWHVGLSQIGDATRKTIDDAYVEAEARYANEQKGKGKGKKVTNDKQASKKPSPAKKRTPVKKRKAAKKK